MRKGGVGGWEKEAGEGASQGHGQHLLEAAVQDAGGHREQPDPWGTEPLRHGGGRRAHASPTPLLSLTDGVSSLLEGGGIRGIGMMTTGMGCPSPDPPPPHWREEGGRDQLDRRTHTGDADGDPEELPGDGEVADGPLPAQEQERVEQRRPEGVQPPCGGPGGQPDPPTHPPAGWVSQLTNKNSIPVSQTYTVYKNISPVQLEEGNNRKS